MNDLKFALRQLLKNSGFTAVAMLELALESYFVRTVRMLVGCTLGRPEVQAITQGAEWREQLKAHLLANPLKPGSHREVEALELLAWMVANQIFDVKVAVPCDELRRPVPAEGIFHEKAGIIEDKTGDRLAFNGSLNETEAGWNRNWESLNIFLSWLGDERRVAEEERNFGRLWAVESKHVITVARRHGISRRDVQSSGTEFRSRDRGGRKTIRCDQ